MCSIFYLGFERCFAYCIFETFYNILLSFLRILVSVLVLFGSTLWIGGCDFKMPQRCALWCPTVLFYTACKWVDLSQVRFLEISCHEKEDDNHMNTRRILFTPYFVSYST
uniref:Uncharacterized protein n=1 Tax=Opuntia streptacantha TaxID=393608 RepID=A0A7C8Z4C5_OPUST